MRWMYLVIKSSQESWDSGTIDTLTVFCRIQKSLVTLLKVTQVIGAKPELEPGLSDLSVCTFHPCLLPSSCYVCAQPGPGPVDEVDGS